MAVFCFVLAAIGLFGGVMAVMPKRTELRLDDQTFTVVSPVKTWKAGWGEVERFEADSVEWGRAVASPSCGSSIATASARRTRRHRSPGKVLGIDEHCVPPGYGNLDNEQLAELLDGVPEPIRRVSELTGRLPLELRPTVGAGGKAWRRSCGHEQSNPIHAPSS